MSEEIARYPNDHEILIDLRARVREAGNIIAEIKSGVDRTNQRLDLNVGLMQEHNSRITMLEQAAVERKELISERGKQLLETQNALKILNDSVNARVTQFRTVIAVVTPVLGIVIALILEFLRKWIFQP